MADTKPEFDSGYEDEKKDKKRTPVLILIFIMVFVAVFCGVYFGIQLYEKKNITPPESTISVTEPKTAEKQEKIKNPIDFKKLQKTNDEIYAWIKIDDTKVDYPIVQNKTDDNFYLKHSAEDKSWSASGAVYTELVNNKRFSNSVTVVYGHNGYGDTMFTTLHYFNKKDFFDAHPYFYIYTEDRRLTYQVVSAFKYDDRHIMNSFNFADTAVLEDFQDMLRNPSSAVKNVREKLDAQLDADSKIVILSTCITNQKSSRYLVSGVLVKDEKTY